MGLIAYVIATFCLLYPIPGLSPAHPALALAFGLAIAGVSFAQGAYVGTRFRLTEKSVIVSALVAAAVVIGAFVALTNLGTKNPAAALGLGVALFVANWFTGCCATSNGSTPQASHESGWRAIAQALDEAGLLGVTLNMDGTSFTGTATAFVVVGEVKTGAVLVYGYAPDTKGIGWRSPATADRADQKPPLEMESLRGDGAYVLFTVQTPAKLAVAIYTVMDELRRQERRKKRTPPLMLN